MTSEEIRLEREEGQRNKILELYRMFDPIEIDTSDLSPEEVSERLIYWLRMSTLLD